MNEKDIILGKWISGECSDEEVREALGDIDLDYLRSVLKSQENLDLPSTDPLVSWEKFEDAVIHKTTPISSYGRRLWVLLSALLVGALLTFYFLSAKGDVVSAPTQDFLLYAFEDGSTARIWPGSTINYDKSTYSTNRLIELNGQAFFDVKKGSSFIVITAAGEVEVMGTSFDVWTMDKKSLSVKCHSGKVKVSDNRQKHVILTAGNSVTIEDSQLTAARTFDLSNEDPKRQLKNYDNALASWVISDLERIYQRKINIDEALSKERFTGVISTNDLNRSLMYLCETMRWSYDQKESKINISTQE